MATGLGRGLGSLIPQKTTPSIASVNTERAVPLDRERVLMVSQDLIEVNSLQPRKRFTDFKLDELVESVKTYGIIQPLLVHRKGDKFELIAGERRLRASKKAGLKEVPVVIREVNEEEKLEIALIENIQREDLNPIDLALAYKQMMDLFQVTQEEVAKKVGKSRSSVANCLRYLGLPEEIQIGLIDGKITEGHAKYIVGLEGEAKQMAMYRKIVHEKLTVGGTGAEIQNIGGTKQSKIKINYADKDKEFAFREFFQTRVEVRRKGAGGQIIIDFFSDEELSNMISKLKK